MSPAHEGDISWTELRRIARSWAGDAAELAAVKPLHGGHINTTLELTMKDGQKAVLKICAHRVDHSFAHEAFQLELLRKVGLPVPEVFAWQVGSLDDPFSYLLMQHMPGVDLATAKKHCTAQQFDDLQAHLAELVLAMHEQTAPAYCRVHRTDGHNGSAPPAPPSSPRWAPFFADVYDRIVCDVEKSPLLPHKCRKHLRKIHQKLDRALPDCDCPRLVHWDLWSTNLLAAPDESGRWRISAVLDPNCKYAHPEAELAYLDLFHTATPTFFKAYQQKRKLPPEYHNVRKPIYQLYTLVDHVHLFGHEYVKPLMEAVDRVSAVV